LLYKRTTKDISCPKEITIEVDKTDKSWGKNNIYVSPTQLGTVALTDAIHCSP